MDQRIIGIVHTGHGEPWIRLSDLAQGVGYHGLSGSWLGCFVHMLDNRRFSWVNVMSLYWPCLMPVLLGIAWCLLVERFLPWQREPPEDQPRPLVPPNPPAVYWLGFPFLAYHLPGIAVVFLIPSIRFGWLRNAVIASTSVLYSVIIALWLSF
ncbi:MAG: hypothetical protein U0793_28250 [Gemmataceae bacterium]